MQTKRIVNGRLLRYAKAADQEGLSYGKWIAKHRPPWCVQEDDFDFKEEGNAITKTCPHCGKQFRTTAKNKIYCREECRIAERQRRKDLKTLERQKEKETRC